jgi:anti-sigma28 factor (negative regulator of flagellin synthesis)
MTSDADLSTVERAVRVAEIRRQIADGTYETPEKLSAAVDALLDKLTPTESEAETLRQIVRNRPR